MALDRAIRYEMITELPFMTREGYYVFDIIPLKC